MTILIAFHQNHYRNFKHFYLNHVQQQWSCALVEQWKPKAWRDDYLELLMLESPGQRWWNAAASMWGYDTRNQLVADVCYEEGREFIKFTNGKEITVETAWRWEWERVLNYATS